MGAIILSFKRGFGKTISPLNTEICTYIYIYILTGARRHEVGAFPETCNAQVAGYIITTSTL